MLVTGSLSASSNTGFRMHRRFPWEESDLKDEIPQMAEMEQEEREQCLKTFQGRLAFLESLLLTDYMLCKVLMYYRIFHLMLCAHSFRP